MHYDDSILYLRYEGFLNNKILIGFLYLFLKETNCLGYQIYI